MKPAIYKSTSRHGRVTWRYEIVAGRDEAGKRIRETEGGFRLEREAQDAADRKVAELKGGVVTTAGTLKEFLEAWLPYHAKAKDLSPKTIERNPTLAAHVIRALGHVPLKDLTPFLVDDLYARLHKPDDPKKVRPLSAKTIRNIHSVIHTAMRRAVKTKLIPFNPTDGCDLPRVDTKEMRVLSYDQLNSYQQAASGSWIDLLIRLGAAIGARRGELLAIRWSDLNWNQRTLKISRSLFQVKLAGEKRKIGVKGTKNRQTREVSVPPSLMEFLRFHKEAQDRRAVQVGAPYRRDLDLVFADPTGEYLSPASVTRAAGRIADKVGIAADFQPVHGLRHSHASALLSKEGGQSLADVSKRLGNKNQHTTAVIYSHSLPDGDEKVASKWDDLMAKNSAGAKLVPQPATTLESRKETKN